MKTNNALQGAKAEGNFLRKKAKDEGFFAELKRNYALFLMLLPGFAATFLFSYLPIFGIIIAFKKFNVKAGIWGSPWCGLRNFKFLFASSDTAIILRNTIGYNLVFIFAGLILNVALAIILNMITNKKLSKVYQTILIMPYFLSFVIVSYIVYAFLSVDNGFINTHILSAFGMGHYNWYAETKPWPWIIIFVNFWKTVGYGSIVYLAAIAGIDSQLYEAAEIDGANRWKQILHVTLPSLAPIMIIMTIMNVGKIFNSDFGLFYQVPMNSGALYSVTNVFSTYVYNTLGKGGITGIGMSSAASFFQSTVGFILVLITNGIVRKIDSENAMF